MEFSIDQKIALDTMKSGANCFLTGKAGTGKTTVLNEFIDWANDQDKNMIVCASTGAAAQRIDHATAYTIHRAFGLQKESIIKPPSKSKKEIEAADIIIIDEISMCRIDLFDYVATAIELAEKKKQMDEHRLARKEGREENKVHIQLIVTGDFTQLEPVLATAEKTAFKTVFGNKVFAFESDKWKAMNFENLILRTVHRQIGDADYTDHLNVIRNGSDIFAVDWFDENTQKEPFTNEQSIILCGKNSTANEKNLNRLMQLEGEEYQSIAEIEGDADMASVNAEYDLRYKPNARVMMLINDPSGGYYNGSFGTIKRIRGDSVIIAVEDTGKVVSVDKHEWTIKKPVVEEELKPVKDENGNPLLDAEGNPVMKKVEKITESDAGTVRQYPFKLAYAITVHKSQGMTLKDGVNLYPEFFAYGQLYVALSRVSGRDKIYINGIIPYDVKLVSPRVNKFMEKIDSEWRT